MYITTAALDPRAIWTELSLLCKLYALYLWAIAIYTLYSLSRMLIRLRSLKNQTATEDHENRDRLLARLRYKSDNLCQLTISSTLLFGMLFFAEIPAIFLGFGDSPETGLMVIFHGILTYLTFATGVFLVLIILHTAEWIVSAQLLRLTLPH